jgi:hypothetical protein
MKYKCDLVKDLIPLVKDDVSSEESSKVVLEHINQCENCKKYYEMIDIDISICETDNKEKLENRIDDNGTKEVVKYAKKVKSRRTKIIAFTGASIIGLLILQFILLWPISPAYVMKFVGEEYSTSNPLDYGKFSGHIEKEKEGRKSYLYIFPKELPDSAEIKNYYYYSDNKGLFDNTYQIYLECTLSKDDYNKEVKRLSELKMTYRGEVNEVKYDTENFEYPAYVTIYADDYSYEYALIDDENNRIIYIYTWFIYPDDVEFSKEYLPKEFMENASGLNGYSMYYIKNAGGGGYRIPEE